MAAITQIKRGNPTIWDYEIQNEGVGVDITGYTVRLIFKTKLTDTDAEAIFDKEQVTHTTPTSGIGSISMTSAECLLIPAGMPYYSYKVYDELGDIYKEYPTLNDVQFVDNLILT